MFSFAVYILFLFFQTCRTEIEWHPGKCLTQKVLKKKPKKGSKNAKPITKIEKCESFFNFFNPPQVPEDDDDIDDDVVRLYFISISWKVIKWLLLTIAFNTCMDRLKSSRIWWNMIMTLGKSLANTWVIYLIPLIWVMKPLASSVGLDVSEFIIWFVRKRFCCSFICLMVLHICYFLN